MISARITLLRSILLRNGVGHVVDACSLRRGVEVQF